MAIRAGARTIRADRAQKTSNRRLRTIERRRRAVITGAMEAATTPGPEGADREVGRRSDDTVSNIPLANPSRAKTSYRHVKRRPMVQCKTNPAGDEKNEGMLQLGHSLSIAKPMKKHAFSALLSHF